MTFFDIFLCVTHNKRVYQPTSQPIDRGTVELCTVHKFCVQILILADNNLLHIL